MRFEELIRRAFCRIFCRDCTEPTPEPPLQSQWKLGLGDYVLNFHGDFLMNLKDDAPPADVSVSWTDSRGKKAPVQAGSLTLESSDPNLVEVTGDATSGFKVGPGALNGVDADDLGVIGAATITAKADADMGDGVKEVAAVGAVVVVAGEASLGTLSIGGQPA